MSGNINWVVEERGEAVELQVRREYWSRRGERVLVTAIDAEGPFPVHFVVLTGPYKGVGATDGSRLMLNGRFLAPENGVWQDHLNDLVAECTDS